jgi:hypothetical protein
MEIDFFQKIMPQLHYFAISD